MEFNQKLQELRKQKGITQEELAETLHVSRPAISKWESGRGYPSIESLKAISEYYCISIDDLLSSNELLTITETNQKEALSRFGDLTFGWLDCCLAIFFFLPLFAQRYDHVVSSVSLFTLDYISTYLKIFYFVFTIATILFGVTTIAMQNSINKVWHQIKRKISFILSALYILLLITSLQPYAASFVFIIMICKALILLKRQ